MNTQLYLYADETSLAVLDGSDEKVLLIGGDFGYGNFGDILQHTNTISLHKKLARYKCVAVMATNAVGDAQFPAFVRHTYGADAVIFVSEFPLSISKSQVPLWPVHAARLVTALHLYGGGFLNDKWGNFILGVTEYLLQAMQPEVYVVSGQQVTAPFEQRVAEHIQTYQPALFGVRDALSQKWMAESGYTPEFSFDDATETLQQLVSDLPLHRGPGLIMHLNISDYTSNSADTSQLQGDLIRLEAQNRARDGVTLLQAYSDRRLEVMDTRESVKQLERDFPFADCRMLELTALAYQASNGLANPLQGDIGYSCSYHVALWLQLAGIPCWLRGNNLFYQQKSQALQIQPDFKTFLREPYLAEHNTNLEQRQKWLERLSNVLLSASKSNRACALPPVQSQEALPWKFKGNHFDEWREYAEGMQKRAFSAETTLVDVKEKLNATLMEVEQLHAQIAALNTVESMLADTQDRLNAALMEVEQLHAQVATLNTVESTLADTQSRLNALNTQVTELGNLCHTQKQRAETAETELASSTAEAQRLLASSTAETQQLRAQISQLLATRSWRITKPFRFIARMLRGEFEAALEPLSSNAMINTVKKMLKRSV